MDFLQVSGRNILVMGVANRKSVAYHSAKVLADAGANVIFSVRSEQRREAVQKLFPDAPCFVCDVEDQIQIDRLRDDVTELLAASSEADGSQNGGGTLHGIGYKHGRWLDSVMMQRALGDGEATGPG